MSEYTYQFYTTAGERAYGKTLKHAKSEGLLPGPSAVLGIINKGNLTNWLVDQAIIAAATNPTPREDVNAFVEAVKKDLEDQRESTLKLGGALHDALEHHIKDGVKPILGDSMLDNMHDPVAAWVERDVLAPANAARERFSERVLVNHELGYAGRTDLVTWIPRLGGYYVVDFKTQGVKGVYTRVPKDVAERVEFFGASKVKAYFYPEFGAQGAAYLNATPSLLGGVMADGFASLVISSNPKYPGAALRVYTADEMARYWELFCVALRLWRLYNEFPWDGQGAA